jgi:hypothetical protein
MPLMKKWICEETGNKEKADLWKSISNARGGYNKAIYDSIGHLLLVKGRAVRRS